MLVLTWEDTMSGAPFKSDCGTARSSRFAGRMGQWLIIGSQEAPLMEGISELMAGRAAIVWLLPFSVTETPNVSVLHGGIAVVLARPKPRALRFASYRQTYLERDVRAITNTHT